MTFFENVLMFGFVTIIFTITVLVCGYGLAWAMNEDEPEDMFEIHKLTNKEVNKE